MARPLYEITADLMKLNDLLEELEGDMSRFGEREPAVTAWLEGLDAEQGAKLDAYLNLIRQNRMEAVAAKAEKEQWAAREKARTSRADHLEAMLKRHLEATRQLKVRTARGLTVSVQKNGGQAPVAYRPGVDPSTLPTEFTRTLVEIDRSAVRVALEAGDQLDFAELLPRGTHLKVS